VGSNPTLSATSIVSGAQIPTYICREPFAYATFAISIAEEGSKSRRVALPFGSGVLEALVAYIQTY
jgi:hypothetical protein